MVKVTQNGKEVNTEDLELPKEVVEIIVECIS